jgi:hypothetical protein
LGYGRPAGLNVFCDRNVIGHEDLKQIGVGHCRLENGERLIDALGASDGNLRVSRPMGSS